MPNLQNLRSIEEVNARKTHEERVESARKAGIASGQAKKKKKLFREEIEKQLGASIEEIIAMQIKKAKQGDNQAVIFLRDTSNEKPTDKVEQITTDISYEEYIKRVENENEY